MADEIPIAPEPRPPRRAINARGGVVLDEEPPRRGFLSKLLAMLIGACLMIVPVGAGLLVFIAPVRRRIQSGAAGGAAGASNALRVTTLDSLPADGTPMRFKILADRQDAWTRYVNQPVGAVYLRRVPGTDQLQCFNVTCPHAGCDVTFNPAARLYQCPCHTSAFQVDGTRVPGVPPRDLDSLEYEIRDVDGRQEVWVVYQNFFSGKAEKKVKS